MGLWDLYVISTHGRSRTPSFSPLDIIVRWELPENPIMNVSLPAVSKGNISITIEVLITLRYMTLVPLHTATFKSCMIPSTKKHILWNKKESCCKKALYGISSD